MKSHGFSAGDWWALIRGLMGSQMRAYQIIKAKTDNLLIKRQ